MKPQSFVILSVATAVVLGAAIVAVVNRTANTSAPVAEGAPLVPGLAEQLNQVVALTVSHDGLVATLARPAADSDVWTVTEKAGYAATLDQVRTTLLALSEAKALEPRTAKPDQYAKIAVDDGGATHVTLRTADGRTLPELLVGKTAGSGNAGSFYARRVGEAQSWLAEGRVQDLSADPQHWLERTLPAVSADRLIAVTVSRPGGAVLSISRKDLAEKLFTATGLPAGKAPDQAAINRLAASAEFLSFDDVAHLDQAETPAAASVTTTFHTADGETLTIVIDHRDGKSWARFARAGDTAMAKTEASRYASWRYRLPDYATKELAPDATDLVEKAAPSESQPPGTPAAPVKR